MFKNIIKEMNFIKLFKKQKFYTNPRFFSCNSNIYSTLKFPNNYTELNNLNRQNVINKILFENKAFSSKEELYIELKRFGVYLSKKKGGIRFAMTLRDDIKIESKKVKTKENNEKKEILMEIDLFLQNFLCNIFCEDSLQLKRITFDNSSGDVLESIVRGETVVKVRSLSDLKKKLQDNSRRVYGLFHYSNLKPLVFVSVAYTKELANSLLYIDKLTGTDIQPHYAIFYSINSPFSSLGGLDLAQRLIKSVSTDIIQYFPSVQIQSTLSPIPGFRNWVNKSIENKDNTFQIEFPDIHRRKMIELSSNFPTICSPLSSNCSNLDIMKWIYNVLTIEPISKENEINHWILDKDFTKSVENPLIWLCSHYLLVEKNKSLLPLNDVARFHLRNGASIHRINWLANPSKSGLEGSFGMMVNYLYDPDKMNERKSLFEIKKEFHKSLSVSNIII
jgi:hypothetical protein